MHRLLRRGRTIQVSRIRGHRGDSNFIYSDYGPGDKRKREDSESFELPPSEDHPLRENKKLEVGRYYRPESTTFSTIDSLFFIQPPDEPTPVLLMFHFLCNESQHDAEERGLRDVDGLEIPLEARKYYIAVTPEGLRLKITVPFSYLASGRLGDKGLMMFFRFIISLSTEMGSSRTE